MEKMIPTTIKIALINSAGNGKKVVFKYEILFGIKSVKETVNIIPAANAREIVIIKEVFTLLKKIGIVPIRVDAPAINENKKAYIVLLIRSPTTLIYEKRQAI